MSSRASSRSSGGHVEALDFDSNRKRPTSHTDASSVSSPRGLLRDDESLLSNVVDGIITNDRRQMEIQLSKYISYASAILSSLCGGSIQVFSIYGHLFLERLHYNQYQVNAISIAAELALYLPVPIVGYLVDRYSPRPISFLAAILFGFGYFLAAFTYKAGPPAEGGWPVGVMILAFVAIGAGTSAIYISAVTACVKNFGRGKHKGLALAFPIASFGISGMWQSQVGSRILYESRPDGTRGDVDAFKFFIFLGVTLVVACLIGAVAQKVVDEEGLIDDAVDELQRSGLLEDSPFFQHSRTRDAAHTTYSNLPLGEEQDMNGSAMARKSWEEEEEERKKTWLLNGETRRFLSDHTMWLLAAGFFLITGPLETFFNNVGTIIGTLYPPSTPIPSLNSAATHVSILAVSSTIARFVAGGLSDLLAPAAPTTQYRPITPSSQEDLDPFEGYTTSDGSLKKRFTLSRVVILIVTPILLVFAFIILLSPVISSNPSLFPLITSFVGFSYGASFALTPIIVSIIWGVTNFGTNWGIVAMVPAIGATVWSVLYSAVYQAHASGDGLCYGRGCWEGTVAGMMLAVAAAAACWSWAYWGKGGWKAKGIVV